MSTRGGPNRDDQLIIAEAVGESLKSNARERSARNVDPALGPVRRCGFNLQEAFSHDDINRLSLNKVTTKSRNNLANGLDQGTNLYGPDRSGLDSVRVHCTRTKLSLTRK